MRATIMYKAGDVRVENVPDAGLLESTDAVIRITRACICGSDLWPYKELEPVADGRPMGHEAIGVVEAAGVDVRRIKRGDLVVMPFAYSDGTCAFCREGLQTACEHGGFCLRSGWIEKELRANFARASRAERRAAKAEPRAAFAAYRFQERALRIELTNGATITLPVKLISALNGASPKDLRAVEVLGRGGDLHWEDLDLHLNVPGLLSSLFSGPEWLAEFGRIGGRNSSAAKAAAARRNGARAAARPPVRVRIP